MEKELRRKPKREPTKAEILVKGHCPYNHPPVLPVVVALKKRSQSGNRGKLKFKIKYIIDMEGINNNMDYACIHFVGYGDQWDEIRSLDMLRKEGNIIPNLKKVPRHKFVKKTCLHSFGGRYFRFVHTINGEGEPDMIWSPVCGEPSFVKHLPHHDMGSWQGQAYLKLENKGCPQERNIYIY